MSSPSTETQTSRSRVVNAALTVGVLLLVSSVLNLVRELLLSNFYGTDSLIATAIALVLPFPDLIFVIISGGALGSAFIPVFARFFSDPDKPDFTGASTMFSAVMTLVFVAGVVSCGIAALLAKPLFSWWYAARLAQQPALLPLLVPMFRIMLLAQVVFVVSGVVMVTLYARQHFLRPALAVVVYALGQIIGVLLFRDSPFGLAWGMVLGAAGHLLIQLPMLRQVGIGFRPKLTLTDPNVRRVMWLMAPRTLGLAFSYLNPIFIPFIAQTMVLGSEAALRFANRIMLTPQAFIGRALGTASFPTFAEMAVRGEHAAMRRMINDLLRLILFIGMPLTIVMFSLAQPLIQIVFERGEFDAASTMLTADALVFYALAFIALSMIEILARAFFALEDTLTPVLVGAGQLAIMFALSFWLGRTLFPSLGRTGVGGVALGYSISNWLEVVVLLWLLRRKMRGLDAAYLLDGVWRIGMASVAMLFVTGYGWRMLGALGDGPVMQAVGVGIFSVAGGLVYLLCCYLLRLPEFRNIIDTVVARLAGRFRSTSRSA